MKIRHEPVPEKYVGNVDQYLTYINEAMNFVEDGVQLKQHHLEENSSMRTMIKLLMNSILVCTRYLIIPSF